MYLLVCDLVLQQVRFIWDKSNLLPIYLFSYLMRIMSSCIMLRYRWIVSLNCVQLCLATADVQLISLIASSSERNWFSFMSYRHVYEGHKKPLKGDGACKADMTIVQSIWKKCYNRSYTSALYSLYNVHESLKQCNKRLFNQNNKQQPITAAILSFTPN